MYNKSNIQYIIYSILYMIFYILNIVVKLKVDLSQLKPGKTLKKSKKFCFLLTSIRFLHLFELLFLLIEIPTL